MEERIKMALGLAVQYGQIDGDHHKAWVIDQMVRALTGCPEITKTATDHRGEEFNYDALGESDEYLHFIAEAKDGRDGPDTYSWNEGIAP